MREIQLTQGQVAIVDDEDYDWLMQRKWYARWNTLAKCYTAVRTEYVGGGRKNRKLVTMLMHRHIMGLTPDDKRQVDHVNHQMLDNRRDNLRICTQSQNLANRGPFRNNSSGYKGVYKRKNRWMAMIGVRRELRYLGLFRTREEAARAYNDAALREFGEFAYLNKV